jgi:hypothetical protein
MVSASAGTSRNVGANSCDIRILRLLLPNLAAGPSFTRRFFPAPLRQFSHQRIYQGFAGNLADYFAAPEE